MSGCSASPSGGEAGSISTPPMSAVPALLAAVDFLAVDAERKRFALAGDLDFERLPRADEIGGVAEGLRCTERGTFHEHCFPGPVETEMVAADYQRSGRAVELLQAHPGADRKIALSDRLARDQVIVLAAAEKPAVLFLPLGADLANRDGLPLLDEDRFIRRKFIRRKNAATRQQHRITRDHSNHHVSLPFRTKETIAHRVLSFPLLPRSPSFRNRCSRTAACRLAQPGARRPSSMP